MTDCIDKVTMRELCDSYLKMQIVLTNKRLFRCLNRELCRSKNASRLAEAMASLRRQTPDRMDPRPHRLEQTIPRPEPPAPHIPRRPTHVPIGVRIPMPIPGGIPRPIPGQVRRFVPGPRRLPSVPMRIVPPPCPAPPCPAEPVEQKDPDGGGHFTQTRIDDGSTDPIGASVPPPRPTGEDFLTPYFQGRTQDAHYNYYWQWLTPRQLNHAELGRWDYVRRIRRPRRRGPPTGTQLSLFRP